jgi:hypothetical protein
VSSFVVEAGTSALVAELAKRVSPVAGSRTMAADSPKVREASRGVSLAASPDVAGDVSRSEYGIR